MYLSMRYILAEMRFKDNVVMLFYALIVYVRVLNVSYDCVLCQK